MSESNSIGEIEWVSEWVNEHELTNACYYWKTIEKDGFWFFSPLILHHHLFRLRLWLKCTHTRRIRSGDHQFPSLYICIFTSLTFGQLSLSLFYTLTISTTVICIFIIKHDLYATHFKSRWLVWLLLFSLQIRFNQCSSVSYRQTCLLVRFHP